jgi:DNA-binding NarL/FixJ family response regulator
MHDSLGSVHNAMNFGSEPDDSTVAAELRSPQPGATGGQSAITIVIVEDHELVADGFRFVLDTIPELTVLEVVSTCADGFAAVEKHCPDVLLLDHWLPDGLGAAQIPGLLDLCASMKILLVTADNSDALALTAISAGAVGVIVKSKGVPVLIAAIYAAARGGAVVTPDVLQQLVRASAAGPAQHDRYFHE